MSEKEESWKAYQADFENMSDQEIDHETRIAENDLAEAESWLEAVASWIAAGKPRRTSPQPSSTPNT